MDALLPLHYEWILYSLKYAALVAFHLARYHQNINNVMYVI